MNVWNPKRLSGWLPDSRGLFVFISGRVCVYVQPLEEPHVLRNDPARQEERKYEVRPILKQFSAAAGGNGHCEKRIFCTSTYQTSADKKNSFNRKAPLNQ